MIYSVWCIGLCIQAAHLPSVWRIRTKQQAQAIKRIRIRLAFRGGETPITREITRAGKRTFC